MDRETGREIGRPDIPYSGCSDKIWNPSGTGMAFVRRYSTHLYGVRVYVRNAKEDFKEAKFSSPDPLEIYQSLPEHPVASFVMAMTDAAARFWIDDHTVSLVAIAEEVGGNDRTPPPCLFATYHATIRDQKAVISRIKLHGPAPFKELARKFALDDR